MTRVLAAVLVAFGLTATSAVLANVEDQIRERISPVGSVCLEGDECGKEAAPAGDSDDGPRSGEEVYSASCKSCHDSGVAGAPIMGEADEWSDRLDKGMETLLDHAINGFNAMPPKGGCGGCSDEEIEAAVEHMVEAVE